MDGDKLNMKFVIVIMLFSLVSSAIVLIWFFKKKKIIKNRNIKDNIKDNTEPGNALKIWRYVAVFWPLCCVVFVGVIIYQSLQGIEERLIIDTGFVIIPLVFFGIGMLLVFPEDGILIQVKGGFFQSMSSRLMGKSIKLYLQADTALAI